MNTYAYKTQENKSHSLADNRAQKQVGGEARFQYADNRSETAVQRKLREMANNSYQTKQATQLQSMADKYSSQPPIQKKENNTGLPDNLKSGIENISGYSMDDVKVHYNSDKPIQLQAHAFAQGTEIHLASGQEKHLPHEAWHVVQQKQGRVKPTTQFKGKAKINDDTGLEKEADVMGQKAITNQLSGNNTGIVNLKKETLNKPTLQRKVGFEFEVRLPFGESTGEKVTSFMGDYEKIKDPQLGPDDHIYDGEGFHVVEDHGGMKILGVESILEYVIHPEEEYKEKDAFLTNIKKAKEHIDKFPHNAQSKFPEGGDKYLVGDPAESLGAKRGGGQSTFGIRLEGVEQMYDEKIADDRFGGENRALKTIDILTLAKSCADETIKLACFDGAQEKNKIKGYLALVSQYLAANALVPAMNTTLDKNRVPFLIRSQLSVIRDATLSKASRQLLSINKDVVYAELIRTSGANENTSIIPWNKEGHFPKAKEWLEGTLAGTDPQLNWGQSKIINPEPVGKQAEQSPGTVVEQRHLKFGDTNVSDWMEEATTVYNKVRKMNGID